MREGPGQSAVHRVVAVHYSKNLDVSDWESRWRQGTVPSRWPYGLDRLQEFGLHVAVPPTARPTMYALGFDESVAPQLARTSTPTLCGTIWLADELIMKRPPARTLARRTILGGFVRRMDRILTFSKATPHVLADSLNIPRSRVSYVPLGIDTDFYPHAPYPEKPLVLSVGNDRARDTETLYGALEVLLAKRDDVEVVVQSPRAAQAPKGVRQVQRFRDHRQLAEYYARASVVVVASKPNLYTSGSTVALEAQATGRPVVITGTPGMQDYVEHRATGLHVPPHDQEALADAMLHLINAPDEAAAMGALAAARVRERNSTKVMVSELYENMQIAASRFTDRRDF